MAGNAGKGRPRGSRNKRTIEARKRFEELEFDPISTLISFAQDETQPPEFRRKCAADLLPYLYPRLLAQKLEHSVEPHPRSIKFEFVKAKNGRPV